VHIDTLKEIFRLGSCYRKGGSASPDWWLSLTGTLAQFGTDYSCIVINNFKERSRQNEKDLILSNELLQKVLDTIPMPIFGKDLNSNFLGCNRFFADEAGIGSPEQLIGKDDHSTPSSEQSAPGCAEVLRNAIMIYCK